MNQPDVEPKAVNRPLQPDDALRDGPGEANQIDNYSEVEEEEFFHGFEPIADPASHLHRSLKTPKPTEAYSLYQGYHAADHSKSTNQPTKKTYCKLNT